MKQRSHSGASKRFRVSKNGKVLFRRQNRNHLLEKKTSRRKRRLAMEGTLSTPGDVRQARRLLRR